jgi:hypothetical protein
MEKFSKKLESLFDAVNQRVAGLRSSVILSKTLECSLKIVFNDTANQVNGHGLLNSLFQANVFSFRNLRCNR